MKTIRSLILFLIILTITISGCSFNPSTKLPTPWPTNYLSTAVALTMVSISTTPQTTIPFELLTTTISNSPLLPTIVETEIANTQPSTTPSQTFRKTPSPTPTPTRPEAAIQIVLPGSLSKLISPIKIEAYAQPGAENRVYIELIGEDGQVIAREIRKYQNLTRLWAPVNLELSFRIEKVAEYARLQIFTEDPFQRTIALYPIHLILQSNGINKVYSNTFLTNRCVLFSPMPNDKINGGNFLIDGEFMPFNKKPIQIELITETGFVLNSKSIQLDPDSNDPMIPFKIDIFYDVQKSTPVRLTIRQEDDHIPGNVYVCSQLLTVSP